MRVGSRASVVQSRQNHRRRCVDSRNAGCRVEGRLGCILSDPRNAGKPSQRGTRYERARNFAEAAERADIKRVIYLGELVDPTANLSPYLRSRHETGSILRHGRVPVTEFRAGMIVGSGSVLFEMIRYLSEREPLLVCPAWFFSTAQPIAIRDVLSYLIAAIETDESIGKLIEIGGPTRLTYAEMLLQYAKERSLKRVLIRTPFNLPRLSAYWVRMVTPIHGTSFCR